jgi:hypothetical protein
MCTVTYIPVGDTCFVTSNRDEKPDRQRALPPSVVTMQTGRLLFPRDADAGGSWFIVHEKGNVLVLLNGAGIRHEPQPPYRKSRGLVLLELADQDSPLSCFASIGLQGIEPFTLVLLEKGRLYQCRWDGFSRQHKMLDADSPHIWSSVTLYDDEMIAARKRWFDEWLFKNAFADQDAVIGFHLMNRSDLLVTVSITSLQYDRSGALLRYLDTGDGMPHHPDGSYLHRLPFVHVTTEPV